MRGSTRIAVYLCVLLVLNEFGPAHFRRVAKHDGHLKKTSPRKSGVKEESSGEKRGIVGTVGKYLLKSLVFGSKVLDTLSSLAAVIATFYNLVSQCCNGQYSDTCKFTEEAENIGKQLDQMSKEINEMNLQTKNLEAAILVASDDFRHTVLTMHDIGEASASLLQSLDPQSLAVLDQASKNLTRLIAEKNATDEQVSYITVETTYFNVLDGILGIAVPLVTTIIPAIPKLKLWIKARMGRYKSYEIEQPLKAPDRNSDRYQASKSWFGKKAAKITFKVDEVKFKLQTKYEKSLNIAKNVKAGFDAAISLAKAAYSIYFTYTTFTKCKDAYDKAKDSLDKMRDAKAKMTEIYNGVTEAGDAMREARDNLHNQLKSEVFLKDLEELKGTLENLIGEGTDDDFQSIINGIGSYITGIKNDDPDFLQSSRLISELSQSLARVPEYFNCYSAKARVARTALDRCKKGEGSLSFINQVAQEQFEDNEQCQSRIGIAPFSDEKLQSMIDENADKMSFSRLCEANDEVKAKLACAKYCQGKEKDAVADETGVSVEVAEIFIKRCKCEITDELKKRICAMKKAGLTAEQILPVAPRLTVEEIDAVQC